MPERTGDVVRRKILVAACDGHDGRTLHVWQVEIGHDGIEGGVFTPQEIEGFLARARHDGLVALELEAVCQQVSHGWLVVDEQHAGTNGPTVASHVRRAWRLRRPRSRASTRTCRDSSRRSWT